MLFYEIRHRQSGEALPEPIFRTEAGAQEWLDNLKERKEAASGVPFIGPIIEDYLSAVDDLYVAPASDVITEPDSGTPVEVVAEAMRQMWNRDTAGIGIVLRARQIVEALEEAGHLSHG